MVALNKTKSLPDTTLELMPIFKPNRDYSRKGFLQSGFFKSYETFY